MKLISHAEESGLKRNEKRHPLGSAFVAPASLCYRNAMKMKTAFSLQSLLCWIFSASAISTAENSRLLQDSVGVTQCDETEAFGRSGMYMASNPMPFCANHGQCRPDYKDHLDAPCICMPGYAGPHCEFLESQVPQCVMPCRNGGTCMVGAQTMAEYLDPGFVKKRAHEQQYCMCNDGFYGEICQTPGTVCGLGYCYNGGSCVEVEHTDESSGESTISHHCDCTTAGDDTTAYAGESCEFPSTTFCSEGMDINGRHFCVNGGMCKGESHLGCNCNEGFVGPVCEFVDMDMTPPECNLQCYNHGICRRGAKDLSILKNFGVHRRHLINQAFNDDFEHCVCPGGYAGLQCEYKVDICPGQEHLCMNGGDCDPEVAPNGDLEFVCDCSMAKTKFTRFTGAYCEMESTEFCTLDGEKTARGKGQDAFCTNDGKCKDYVSHGQEHPGCNCPRGFQGDQCEFVGVDFRIGDNSTESRSGLVAAITIILMLLTFGMLLTVYLRRKRVKRELMIAAAVEGTSEPPQLRSIQPWRPDMEISDPEEEFDGASHSPSHSSENTLGGNSTTSSLTVEEQADGRVTLMKTKSFKPQEVPPSIHSIESDLHIFNDSHDEEDANTKEYIQA